MSEVVQKLSQGEHPVVAVMRPDRTVRAFKESLDRGYVHVKFTDTAGGTELGVLVDRQRSDFALADFESESGQVTIVGTLTLDWVKVRCIAEIDLASLEGHGRLEPLEG